MLWQGEGGKESFGNNPINKACLQGSLVNQSLTYWSIISMQLGGKEKTILQATLDNLSHLRRKEKHCRTTCEVHSSEA